MRTAQITRNTKETNISAQLSLEVGQVLVDTGIGFFDHMLTAFAFHAGFGLVLKAQGDLQVDAHHTVEDVGIVLGQAFAKCLEDKTGIERFASAFVPMDEALAFCSVDIGGRSFLVYSAPTDSAALGQYDSCLSIEFFRAFAANAQITMHIKSEYGSNLHHITEAVFKATGRALRGAAAITGDKLLSTKGTI